MQKREFLHSQKKENLSGKINKTMNETDIKEVLKNSKTIAMIGVSSEKKGEEKKTE